MDTTDPLTLIMDVNHSSKFFHLKLITNKLIHFRCEYTDEKVTREKKEKVMNDNSSW